ncbi:MAG: FHA domain-containing protein, partial [bacterium]
MPKLILRKNSEAIKEFELTGPKPVYLIGSSSSNDLVIPDDKVAPRHLRVEKHDGCYYIEALETFAGTHLNGRPLVKRAQIVDGDDISIGDHSLLFENIVSKTMLINIQDDSEIELIGEDDIPAPLDSVGEKTNALEETEPTISATETAFSDHDELFDVEEFPDETLTEELTANVLTPQFPPTKPLFLLAIDGPY